MKKDFLETKFIHHSWFKEIQNGKLISYKTKREAIQFFAYTPDFFLDVCDDKGYWKRKNITLGDEIPQVTYLTHPKDGSYRMTEIEVTYFKECKERLELFKVIENKHSKAFRYKERSEEINVNKGGLKEYYKLDYEYATELKKLIPINLLEVFEVKNQYMITLWEMIEKRNNK